MHRFAPFALAALLTAGVLGADEPKDVRAILDKALSAAGGAKKLARYPAATWQGTGTHHGFEGGLAVRIEGARQGADRFVQRVRAKHKGKSFERVLVIHGARGWVKLDKRVQEMTKEELVEQKERLYAAWVATLAPLREKGFTLSGTGALRVDGREAVGVKVAREGRREIVLYFDKKTGVLLKMSSTVKDLLAGGKEVKEEVRYAEWRSAPEGVKYPAKVKVYRDGKLVAETATSEYEAKVKLADKVFAKP